MARLSKEERDEFVLRHAGKKTNKAMAEETGWSETTIKSVKRRLGLQKKSAKVLELEAYCLDNYDGSNAREIAEVFSMKHDNVRDTLKSLGIYKSEGLRSYERIVAKYPTFTFFEDYGRDRHDKIKIQCKECGGVFFKRPNDLVSNEFICYHLREGESFLYLMQSPVGYKIGYSNNPERRRYYIEHSGNLEYLDILHTFKGAISEVKAAEAAYHEYFRDRRVDLGSVFDGSTEFFELNPKDLEFIRKTALNIGKNPI